MRAVRLCAGLGECWPGARTLHPPKQRLPARHGQITLSHKFRLLPKIVRLQTPKCQSIFNTKYHSTCSSQRLHLVLSTCLHVWLCMCSCTAIAGRLSPHLKSFVEQQDQIVRDACTNNAECRTLEHDVSVCCTGGLAAWRGSQRTALVAPQLRLPAFARDRGTISDSW